MSLADALRRRRSIRGLVGPPLSREEIEGLVELALLAPAPHHTRPWRFVSISQGRRAALASAMGAAWEADMVADGLEESVRRRALERYLFGVLRPQLQALPYDERAAEWHASERARLERLGQTPPFVDGQIAAIVHANDLTLVTANVQDFAPFEGLRVEDWRQG